MGIVHQTTLLGLGVGLFMEAVTVGWWQVTAEASAIIYIAASFVVLLTTVFPVLAAVNVSEPLTGPRVGFLNGMGMGLALFLLLLALLGGQPVLGF